MLSKNILITGASSGIGRQLAISYSKLYPNAIIFLFGRNLERLEATAKACDAKTYIFNFDISNEKDLKENIEKVHKIAGRNLDLVVANAGVSAGTLGGPESHEQVKQIFIVNIDSVVNTIQFCIPEMVKHKSGQIAIVSSNAGFRGLPSAPSYSATKAAVRVYGEALRDFLVKYNVKVNVICPGYVKTPMTAINTFPMPFLISAEKCARIIINGLAKNKPRIITGKPIFYFVNLCAFLGPRLTAWLFRRLPGKVSSDVINNA